MRTPGNMTTRELLRTYAGIMAELRRREVTRSANNPVADVAELVASNAFCMTLERNSKAGYDGVGSDGTRYQVKGRRLTKENMSTQLSAIRNLRRRAFDYLIAVVFNEDFSLHSAYRVPRSVVAKHARFSKHVNGHILTLTTHVVGAKGVRDVTPKLRAVRL